MKVMIAAGISALGLAAVGVGVPRVMAAAQSAPAPASHGALVNHGARVNHGAPVNHGGPAGVGVPAGWPAAKAAAMAAENRLREQAAGRPVVAPDAPDSAVPATGAQAGAAAGTGAEPQSAAVAPQAAYTAGILPLTDGGPFGSAEFVGTNVWNGPVGGRWEVVQAGGAPADRALGSASPDKAGLFVYTESRNPAVSAGRVVAGVLAPSPDPPGQFTVARAAGDRLTLTLSGTRQRYYFDVLTRQFTR